jgi:hypothetical protein
VAGESPRPGEPGADGQVLAVGSVRVLSAQRAEVGVCVAVKVKLARSVLLVHARWGQCSARRLRVQAVIIYLLRATKT